MICKNHKHYYKLQTSLMINFNWGLYMQILSVKMIIILKGLIKQPVTRQSPTFPSFFILTEGWANECFFSFLTKVFVKSENLMRLHHQVLLYVKIDKICIIGFNVILAFLEDLRPKNLFLDQPWWLPYFTYFTLWPLFMDGVQLPQG